MLRSSSASQPKNSRRRQQPRKPPVPPPVEHVAGCQQQPILPPVRQRPVRGVHHREKHQEHQRIEDHPPSPLRPSRHPFTVKPRHPRHAESGRGKMLRWMTCFHSVLGGFGTVSVLPRNLQAETSSPDRAAGPRKTGPVRFDAAGKERSANPGDGWGRIRARGGIG